MRSRRYTAGGVARLRGPSVHALPVRRALRAVRRRRFLSRRDRHRRPGQPDVRLLRHRLLREPPGGRPSRQRERGAAQGEGAWLSQNPAQDNDQPLLVAEGLGKILRPADRLPRRVVRALSRRGAGDRRRIRLGQVDAAAAAVGAAGAERGHVSYRMRDGVLRDLADLGEAERRFLFRTDWGYRAPGSARRACAWRSRPAPMSASG